MVDYHVGAYVLKSIVSYVHLKNTATLTKIIFKMCGGASDTYLKQVKVRNFH